MTTLKETLRGDLTTAIKARDELTAATVRLVLAAVSTQESAGDTARELSDEEIVAVLSREAKKRREATEAFTAGGRPELADREQAELAVLQHYLPAELTKTEIAAIVAAAITESGARGPAALGAVMKIVTPRTRGRADGAQVAAEVRSQLDAGAPS